MNNCLLIILIFFFTVLGCARLVVTSTTLTELYGGTPKEVLASNKPVEVRVDNFSRYTEPAFEVFQYRLLEILWNNDNIVVSWFKKACGRANKYTFLHVGPTPRFYISRCFNPFAHRPIFVLQNNPTVFKRGTVTGEEKSDAVVSCEVD